MIDSCIASLSQWLTAGGFRLVACQFPDSLLDQSVEICDAIESTSSSVVSCYILADTSFGSCCVDIVAARHVDADCIVHFGDACLTPLDSTANLPVFYVLPQRHQSHSEINVDFGDIVPCNVSVTCELSHRHLLKPCVELIRSKCHADASICIGKIVIPEGCASNATENDADSCCRSSSTSSTGTSTVLKLGRMFSTTSAKEPDLANGHFVFIGSEDSPLLLLLMLTYPNVTIWCLSLSSGDCCYRMTRMTVNLKPVLRRRLFLIEKTKDAKTVGILMNTLGLDRHLETLDRCKALIRASGKSYYVFTVGKINVAKLANFPEIDVFVIVSCPFQTFLDEDKNRDFLQPMITPFELEIACNPEKSWYGQDGWLANYHEFVGEKLNILPDSIDETHFSLISGKIHSNQVPQNQNEESSDSLVQRDETMQVAEPYSAANFFTKNRSWKGLELKLGENSVEKAKIGRSGIASHYENEPD